MPPADDPTADDRQTSRPDSDIDAPPAAHDAGRLHGRWYYESLPVPYHDKQHWTTFFGQIADAIVTQLQPRKVLDAGCATGYLVAALRERGVDAYGFDVSDVAIADAVEAAQPYIHVGSLTEPIDGSFDLITCIEVVEHIDPADAATAVGNLCAASPRVLFSSTPDDQHESTHVNVQPPERWSQLFASHGFFRDFRHDAGYLTPWAVLYRREERLVPDVVYEYDRAWAQLHTRTIEQRKALVDIQGQLEALRADSTGELVKQLRTESDRLQADKEELQKEILRLRDAVIGKDAELGTALGRVAELEAYLERYEDMEKRLNAVLTSTSWRLMWTIGTPIRKLRERGGQSGEG